MTRAQAAARLSTEITRIVGSVNELRNAVHDAEFAGVIPYREDIHDLHVAAALLPLLVARIEGKDPLAALVRTFGAEAAERDLMRSHPDDMTCPCAGKPNMDPRCARQGMCMVEDGDAD